jgi:hypothetical protein
LFGIAEEANFSKVLLKPLEDVLRSREILQKMEREGKSVRTYQKLEDVDLRRFVDYEPFHWYNFESSIAMQRRI